MTCLHCRAQTTNGLALCDLCQRLVADVFEMLPVYFHNLARQRRAGRPNGSLGTSGTWLIRRGESEGSRIAHALEMAVNDLDTWARVLTDDRDIRPAEGDTEAETVVALCAFLETNLTSIATLEWAGQFVRDIRKHELALRELTETVVPGWYAGACRQVTGRDMEGNVYICRAPNYVIPGMTWMTCPACGATTHASEHLEVILEEARGWVAKPKTMAEALVALLDAEQSVERLYGRIRKWESLGWLQSIRRLDDDGDPIGPKRYRLCDVLDLIGGSERMTAV